jgi:hypothetical protein
VREDDVEESGAIIRRRLRCAEQDDLRAEAENTPTRECVGGMAHMLTAAPGRTPRSGCNNVYPGRTRRWVARRARVGIQRKTRSSPPHVAVAPNMASAQRQPSLHTSDEMSDRININTLLYRFPCVMQYAARADCAMWQGVD